VLDGRPLGFDLGHGAAQAAVEFLKAQARRRHHLLQRGKLAHAVVGVLLVQVLRRLAELLVHALESNLRLLDSRAQRVTHEVHLLLLLQGALSHRLPPDVQATDHFVAVHAHRQGGAEICIPNCSRCC